MDDAATRQVRSFNRTVTQRVGALTTSTSRAAGRSARPGCCGRSATTAPTCARCARGSTSTPATSAGCCARSRRTGWSRSSRARPTSASARVRLTAAGRAERELLDRRSDELAASLLAPLSDAPARPARRGDGRRRAAADRGARRGRRRGPDAARAARFCIESYFAELDRRFDAGFDPGRSISADADELDRPPGCSSSRGCAASRSAAAR